jgi:hypothetical protein
MTSRGWLLWSTVGVVAVAAALSSEYVHAQRGFGFGPPDREKRSVVGQFDADSNGRLNDAERAEARAWLATQSQGGAGPGRRGFGPPPEFAGRLGKLSFLPVAAVAAGSRWRRLVPACLRLT